MTTPELTNWRKSSRSNNQGNCVEAGSAPGVVGVRDSKQHGGPVLRFTASDWKTFVTAVKGGDHKVQ
jgi:hypothetical protein